MTEYPLAKTGGYARIYLKWYSPIFKPYIYMENSVYKIWFKMKSVAIEGKCFFCSQNHFREHWHTINSSRFINIFLVLKNIWRIINIKNNIHYILSQKNQNFRQPKLDISSRQIYRVISYHQYISRSRYAGEGENYRKELQDVGDLLSKCW